MKFEEKIEFKVGDEVIILDKTAGWKLGLGAFKKGDKGIISILDPSGEDADCTVKDIKTGAEEFFNFSDLEKVEEKDETEYKFKRSFSPQDLNLISSNATLNEMSKFYKKMDDFGYSKDDVIQMSQEFINYIKSSSCMFDWFRRNFIEKRFVFKPFEVKIQINSSRQYWNLFHRLNINSSARFDPVERTNDSKGDMFWDVKKYKDKVNPEE